MRQGRIYGGRGSLTRAKVPRPCRRAAANVCGASARAGTALVKSLTHDIMKMIVTNGDDLDAGTESRATGAATSASGIE